MYTDTELHQEERLCLTRDRRPGSTRHQLFNLSLQVLVQQGGLKRVANPRNVDFLFLFRSFFAEIALSLRFGLSDLLTSRNINNCVYDKRLGALVHLSLHARTQLGPF